MVRCQLSGIGKLWNCGLKWIVTVSRILVHFSPHKNTLLHTSKHYLAIIGNYSINSWWRSKLSRKYVSKSKRSWGLFDQFVSYAFAVYHLLSFLIRWIFISLSLVYWFNASVLIVSFVFRDALVARLKLHGILVFTYSLSEEANEFLWYFLCLKSATIQGGRRLILSWRFIFWDSWYTS